jgi:hypothetical protein
MKKQLAIPTEIQWEIQYLKYILCTYVCQLFASQRVNYFKLFLPKVIYFVMLCSHKPVIKLATISCFFQNINYFIIHNTTSLHSEVRVLSSASYNIQVKKIYRTFSKQEPKEMYIMKQNSCLIILQRGKQCSV